MRGGNRDLTLNRKRHWKNSVTAWDHLRSAETLAEATNKHDTPVKMTWPDFKTLGKKGRQIYSKSMYPSQSYKPYWVSVFLDDQILSFFYPLVIVTIPKCSILLTPGGLFFLYSSITLEAWIMRSLTIFLVIPQTIFLYFFYLFEWSDCLAWFYSFISKPFISYPSARRNAQYKRKRKK